MKIDNKEKYKKLKQFLLELKRSEDIVPFLQTEEMVRYGIYDFYYINKNPPSITSVQRKLQESYYDYLDEFTEDIKKVFISVSDYCLMTDPMQNICSYYISKIEFFVQNFLEDFRSFSPQQQTKTIAQENEEEQSQAQADNKKQKKSTKQKKVAKQSVKQKAEKAPINYDLPSTLSDKLQMVFLLRENENNEDYLRSIGKYFKCGEENEEEFVITISDKKPFWKYLLSKNK